MRVHDGVWRSTFIPIGDEAALNVSFSPVDPVGKSGGVCPDWQLRRSEMPHLDGSCLIELY